MAAAPFRKRVLRWGNSYGIRLTRRDLDRLRLREGQEVAIRVKPCSPKVDWASLPRLSLGPEASARHDEIMAAGFGAAQE